MYLKYNSSLELDKPSRKKLFFVIAGVHVLFLVVMYLGFFLQGYFWSSAPAAIAVNLISPSAFAEMQASDAQPTPQPKQQQTAAKQPTPAKPKETKAITKVPVKKTPKTLDVSQIKKSTEVITKQPSKPVKPTQPQKTFKPLSASELAATLQKSTNSVKFASPSANASPNAQANPAMMGYYDQLSSYLYSSWEQPAKFAGGGQPPTVLVKLFISADGRLTNYQIVDSSGFDDMDESVKRMLSSIDRLPVPPNGAMTIEASLILTN